jgi:hypothetical protein
MPETLDELRAKARAHQARLDAEAQALTVQQLAARWGCSDTAVLTIPAARLPYFTIGRGTQKPRRRYTLTDVQRYERRADAGAGAA